MGKTKTWISQRKKEYYYKKAKAENYRSRATYKLAQTIEKYHFIRYGDVVVDLGAAPGGWIQSARKAAGKNGFVLGVDLNPIEPFEQTYIRTIVCDLTDSGAVREILSFLPTKADVVLSDMSPNIIGVWEVDHARQIDLATKALEVAQQILCPHGNFFTKVFQGDLLDQYLAKVKVAFDEVKLIKPKASRAQSSEMYILALGLKVPEE
ncbi:MAG: RlmE family RNA methyltransferase [Candidatus Bathyarchaeota archaeon]|nr:RlmE family RNA methyltransferase [Candidatus Bathyarchaeota archaeon]